jgi:hypothetical protein
MNLFIQLEVPVEPNKLSLGLLRHLDVASIRFQFYFFHCAIYTLTETERQPKITRLFIYNMYILDPTSASAGTDRVPCHNT